MLADLADKRRKAEEEAELKEQREMLRRKRMKEVLFFSVLVLPLFILIHLLWFVLPIRSCSHLRPC